MEEDYNEMECNSFFESQYKYIRDLGKGGFGKVVLCENVVDKVKYAVKVIPMTEGDTKDFLLESQTLAKVDHPNIGRYQNSWMESGVPDIVKDLVKMDHPNIARYHWMESGTAEDVENLVDEDSEDVEDSDDEDPEDPPCRTLFISMKGYSSSLFDQIQNQPPLSRESITKIFKGLVAALAHLQSLKIVHGDVKPGNILLDETFNPKLIDFGSAFTVGESVKEEEGGTEVYAPKGEDPTYALDIYGLGMSMIEAICSIKTGQHREQILHVINGGEEMPQELEEADADNNIKGAVINILSAASPNDRPDIAQLTSLCIAIRLESEDTGI